MRSLLVEVRRASHRRAYRVTVVVACLLAVGIVVKSAADHQIVSEQAAFDAVCSGVGFFAAFAGAFLGASLVASESATGGLVSTLLWEPRRRVVLAAMLLGAAVAAVVLGLVLLVVASGAVAVAASSTHASGGPGVGTLSEAGRAVVAAAVAGGLGAALATALGSAAGVGFLLSGLLVIGEPLLSDWLAQLTPWMPMACLTRLAAGHDASVDTGLTSLGAAPHLAPWVFAAVAAAWLRFRHQEIR